MTVKLPAEMVDGYERRELSLEPGSISYATLFRKDGETRVVWVDRIMSDRFGPEWRQREELRLLRDPAAKPQQFRGQFKP